MNLSLKVLTVESNGLIVKVLKKLETNLIVDHVGHLEQLKL